MAELITGYGIEQQDTETDQAEAMTQYLTFQAADELLAIEILDTKEIIEVGHMTPVPMMPDFIRGVINLRGRVVPVVDLAARMRCGLTPVDKRCCIILISVPSSDDQRQTVGMLVAAVNEIIEIEENHIQPAPTMGSRIDTRFIKAMARIEEDFFILLDTDHLLSSDEAGQIAQMKTRHSATVTAAAMEKTDTE